jgi:hypothetical protein
MQLRHNPLVHGEPPSCVQLRHTLDGPVGSDHRADRGGQHHQRGDVEACFVGYLAADFAPAFDHDNSFQAGPLMARLKLVDIVDHGVVSGLDTAVIAIDSFIRADRCILVFQGFLLLDEDLDILT